MTRGLLLPVGIVAYVAVSYLRGVPPAGDDLFLVAGCAAALGTVLGGLSGTFTAVYEDSDGVPLAKDGVIAAALWVLGHLDSGASRPPTPYFSGSWPRSRSRWIQSISNSPALRN